MSVQGMRDVFLAEGSIETFNAQCTCARRLCVCVCTPFSGSLKRLYNTLNTTIGFMLNAKDFQLMDFSEKASFKSYSVFLLFL